MATGKYCKIGGAIRQITSEYTKIDGAIRQGTMNYPKIGGVIKTIPVADWYLYTAESVNDELYRVSNSAVEDWHVAIADGYRVAYDGNNGYSYWACGTNVYCLDDTGATQWTYTGHSVQVTALCVDFNGTVYTGDLGGTVKAIASFPGIGPGYSVIWSGQVGVGHAIYALAVDVLSANNLLYIGTGFSADAVWRTTTTEAAFYRIYASAADISALAVDADGKLYVGDNVGNYRQMANSGYIYWTKTRTGAITQIAIGHDGFGYCSVESEKKLLKWPRGTGVTDWEYTPATAAYAYGIGTDLGGNVYGVYRNIAGQAGNYIYKVDSSGAFVWRWQSFVNTKYYGLAITPGLVGGGFE